MIGIYIHPESKGITKVLKPGWFPFGDYPAPEDRRIIDCPSFPKEISDIYSPRCGVKISISAIVGKNGSGKSTLLDILYRIINNFAIHIIGMYLSIGVIWSYKEISSNFAVVNHLLQLE